MLALGDNGSAGSSGRGTSHRIRDRGDRVLERVGEIQRPAIRERDTGRADRECVGVRSEEHTSELQSRQYLVCRPLLEKQNSDKQALARTPTAPSAHEKEDMIAMG